MTTPKMGLKWGNLKYVTLSVIFPVAALFGLSLLLSTPTFKKVRASSVKVGLVTDIGTLNDLSFNWLSYQGLLRAESEFGVVSTVYTSTSSSDYGPNLQACALDGNDLCIGVGFLLADAISNTAAVYTSTKFAIVDFAYDSYPSNLRGMVFASDEVAYLAGTLAGLMTQSDIIGNIGGMTIPPVLAFTNGYRAGAHCANPDVVVLTDFTNDFGNPDLGAQVAQGMIAQGADVIFAPAGPTGGGAVLTATQSGVWGIGVDTDYYTNLYANGAVTGSNYLLSSAMKRFDNATYYTIRDVVSSTFTSGMTIYTLAVDGVGLAPFHDTDSVIPQSVKNALNTVKQGIIAGSIDVKQPCPAAGIAVGLVSDELTLTDQSYNWLTYQGLLRAESEFGVVGTVYTSTSSSDYEPNLQACALDGNDLCIGVGFLLANAISNTAAVYTSSKFAIVDFAYDSYPSNLRGIVFASDEAGYLAGTLAGLMTQSDIVGDIGGMEIPPVTAFTLSYRNGAQCANPNATVLITYTNDFFNPDLGAQAAQAMIEQGADVVFAAAGPTGYGTVLTATQSGVWGIGVDVDYYVTVFGNGTVSGSNRLLTSALKRVDNAVYYTIRDVVSNTFTSGIAVYDLAVDGVGLAPYHETTSAIPTNIKARVEQVKQDILAGRIDVNSTICQNYIFLPLVIR